MKAMKQIVVAVSLVVISAMAPVVEAQQGVEKAAPGTLVAPADALNSLVKMTESQMIGGMRGQTEVSPYCGIGQQARVR